MATWQFGPFDNDEAVEWCAALEEADPDQRAELTREALAKMASPAGVGTAEDAARAIAAAAVVLQALTGKPVSASAYSPHFLAERNDIQLDSGVRELAVRAIDVVLAVGSAWRIHWQADVEEEEAITVVEGLRNSLAHHGSTD
ncbi:DUF4259 domain-containing protein [Solwaraspora sp. WMMA2059]|uniref:DUF4259 domain-containing protein n=1 Tax=Solwaraspora sp. WMMA2059 TaxID=3015160 RepID=UPI00248C2B1D|nr:DUF4259 domain-containing protein [Solwaraspora sp. WMMA2059]WBB96400.1 DUF4259 domain-containing protein [Solwaraspora sp. WMMA2059]